MRKIAILGLLVVAVGCAGRNYTTVRYFALHPEISVTQAEATDQTLGIRPLSAGRMYTERMLSLDEGNAIDAYPYAAWTDMPRDVVSRSLEDAVRATGHFKDVGDAADLKMPTLLLTGDLRRFEEVRSGGTALAICEVHLEMRTYDTRALVWAGNVTANEALKGKGPAALAEAMQKAVAKVVAEAAAQIAAK